MKYFVETYESIDKMLYTFRTRQANEAFKGKTLRSQESGESSFLGTNSYEEAEELLTNGWEEPLKDLEIAAKGLRVKTNVTVNKVRPRNSIVGYAPCVPAAIMGLPESMISIERTPSKVKAVTIIYSSDVTAGFSKSDILKSGAAVLKLINELELKGYRVQLINEFCAALKGDETVVGRLKIKDWRQPLDLKKITFPLAHAAMTRRISFRFTETVPGLKGSGWGTYGGTADSRYGYDKTCKLFREEGLLSDHEYYMTVKMVEEEGYDSEMIMKRAGMNL